MLMFLTTLNRCRQLVRDQQGCQPGRNDRLWDGQTNQAGRVTQAGIKQVVIATADTTCK